MREISSWEERHRVRMRRQRLKDAVFIAVCTLLVLAFVIAFLVIAHARDFDGHYAQQDPKMHAWFNGLASGKGLCCSIADGRTLSDPDWGTHDDHYWVIVDGARYAVSADALITEPNKFGEAVVWPYVDADGKTQIRCFMPGAGL